MQPRYNPQMMADIQRKQALARMNPQTAPIASNNIFGDQMQKNNEAFMQARERGQDGAPMIQKAQQLAPLNFLENTVGMDPAQREAILGMPMPRADTGEGGFARQPSQPPDPFSGGYKPRGKGDPYGPLPPRPRNFAMGGLVTNGPTMDELSQQTGGQPFSYSAQGPSQFSPFKDMMPRLGRRNAEGFAKFADGGPVIGPGGHKEDAIPAKLSHGEYVMPAEVVQFFGIDRLNKMVQKAKEGASEQPMPEMKPDPMAAMGPMMPGYSKGGPVMPMRGMVPGYAEGGLVTPSFARFEALKNAQSQMPELIPLREQEAADIRMAAMGITDVGGGRKVLQNRYGTGFSLPDSGGASVISDGNLMRNVGTPTQPRLETIPDPVQGPWGTGGAMPDLDRPQRVADIGQTIAQMQAEAPRRRAADIAAAEPMRPTQNTPIPAFAMMPQPSATRHRQPFLSPSEKDAMAREQLAAALPTEQDMMAGMTGMEKRQFRAQLAMNQANDKADQLAAGKKAEAQRQFMPAIDATTGQAIPNRFVNASGQQFSVETPQAKAPSIAPAAAKALLTSPNASTLDAATLAEISADNRYDVATRGLAQRQLAKTTPAETKTAAVRKTVTSPTGLEIITRSDGTQSLAKTDFTPNVKQMVEAHTLMAGKEPQTKEEWNAAYFHAQGKQPPQTAATQAPRTFANEDEAIKAGFKGIAMINGRRARID